GPQVLVFRACRLERSHSCTLPAGPRHAVRPATVKTVEQDTPVAVPSADGPECPGGVTEGSRRAAVQLDGLELPACEEPERAAVRRPKQRICAFSARDRLRPERSPPANP